MRLNSRSAEPLLNSLWLFRVKPLSLDITSSQHRPGGAGLFIWWRTLRCNLRTRSLGPLKSGAEYIAQGVLIHARVANYAPVAPLPGGADGAARHPYHPSH